MSDGRLMVLTRAPHQRRFRRQSHHHRRQSLRREHPAVARERRQLRARRRRRDAQRRAHGPGPLARRPLQFRFPAVGRLGPNSRELDAVPPARHRRPDTHRALHRLASRRSERADGAAALQHLDVHALRRTPSCPVMPPIEGVMVTEAIAAQPRVPLPAVILDKVAPLDLDADLVAEGAGLLSIRSVYDIMGVGSGAHQRRSRHQHRQRLQSDAHAVRQSPGALHSHREAGFDSGRR